MSVTEAMGFGLFEKVFCFLISEFPIVRIDEDSFDNDKELLHFQEAPAFLKYRQLFFFYWDKKE